MTVYQKGKHWRWGPTGYDLANGFKKCRKCKETAAIEAFSKNRTTRDGYAQWCRACIKARWDLKIDERRAKSREYYKTPRGLEINQKWSRHHRETFPEKVAAHNAVCYAVKHGKLVKPKTCAECGGSGKIEGHHYAGYARPARLIVRWLCKLCHVEADRLADGLLHGLLMLSEAA